MVAGGSGLRFGAPKQFERLRAADDAPRVLDRSVAVALDASDGVVLVVPADVVDDEARLAASMHGDRVRVVAGGASRAASVRAGLAGVPAHAEVIAVHDAARPFADAALFAGVVGALVADVDGAVPGIPVTDTIKVVDEVGTVVDTPDRATLVAVQTPQAFRASVLRRVHADAAADGSSDLATDDASMVERAGGRVVVVPGDPDNVKITRPADLVAARERVEATEAS